MRTDSARMAEADSVPQKVVKFLVEEFIAEDGSLNEPYQEYMWVKSFILPLIIGCHPECIELHTDQCTSRIEHPKFRWKKVLALKLFYSMLTGEYARFLDNFHTRPWIKLRRDAGYKADNIGVKMYEERTNYVKLGLVKFYNLRYKIAGEALVFLDNDGHRRVVRTSFSTKLNSPECKGKQFEEVFDLIKPLDKNMRLRNNSAQYVQLQIYLLLTEYRKADFVFHSDEHYHCVSVRPDPVLHSRIKENIRDFFERYILPIKKQFMDDLRPHQDFIKSLAIPKYGYSVVPGNIRDKGVTECCDKEYENAVRKAEEPSKSAKLLEGQLGKGYIIEDSFVDDYNDIAVNQLLDNKVDLLMKITNMLDKVN